MNMKYIWIWKYVFFAFLLVLAACGKELPKIAGASDSGVVAHSPDKVVPTTPPAVIVSPAVTPIDDAPVITPVVDPTPIVVVDPTPVVFPLPSCSIVNGRAVCDGNTLDLYLNFSVPRAYNIVDIIVTNALNNCVTINVYMYGRYSETHSICGTQVVLQMDTAIGENGWVLQ